MLSRRSNGLSIGLNISPEQACTFRCLYCQVDRNERAPAEPVDLAVLTHELDGLLEQAVDGSIWGAPLFDDVPASLRRLNDIAISGNGEPTLSPQFPAVVDAAAAAKRRHGLEAVKIVLITNASLLHTEPVRRALDVMSANQGETWAKLDAGTEAHYRRVNRSRVPFQRILDNLLLTARRHPVVIQSLFLRIQAEGPDEAEIGAYCGRLRHLLESGGRLAGIQVYSVARTPAEPSAAALPDRELDAIAERVREATGLPVACYYGR